MLKACPSAMAIVFAFCYSPDDVRKKKTKQEILESFCPPCCPQAALAGGVLGVLRPQHHPGNPSTSPLAPLVLPKLLSQP